MYKIFCFLILFSVFFSIPLKKDLHILASSNESNTSFLCQNDGAGLSAVDVLKSTGQHSIFLSLLETHDNEGYMILSDPILSDKTIWAPVDSAFELIENDLQTLDSEAIKAILGFHISPPLSRPNGVYPIITFDYLNDQSPVTYRTRTGVLTGSEQRITSTYVEGVYQIENAAILSTAYCTQAGSVFAINSVITDVELPSWFTKLGFQLVRTLFYDDIRFVIYSTVGSLMITGIGFILYTKLKKRS